MFWASQQISGVDRIYCAFDERFFARRAASISAAVSKQIGS